LDSSPDKHDAEPDLTWVDRVSGPLWVVLGVAMAVGAARIDRMESQGVKWFGAPGLVPGLLGLAMIAAGIALSLRAWRATVPVGAAARAPGAWQRVGLSLALCLVFAIGLVGHGLPFSVACCAYLFVHVAVLQWSDRRAAGQTLRGLLVAGAVALGGAVLVPLIFQDLFLVRLP
jgi:Tripartite tricarboxylate transporter TctB family